MPVTAPSRYGENSRFALGHCSFVFFPVPIMKSPRPFYPLQQPAGTCSGLPPSLLLSGAVNPSSFPTSRTYGASRCRSASLPRVSRDFTVPSEISSTSAISSYDISSRSRKISVVRYGSGTFRQLFFHPMLHFVMRHAVKRRIRMIGQRHLHRILAGLGPSDSTGSIEVSFALCRNHHRRRFAASCSAMR